MWHHFSNQSRPKPAFVILLIVLAIAGISCDKKEAPVSAPASVPNPTSAPVPNNNTPDVANVPTANEPPVTLEDINRALNSWMQVSSDFPTDLQQLADRKLIPRLPPPPAGMKYVINRQAIRVELVSQ